MSTPLFFSSDQKAKAEIDGIDTENLAVLERLKQNQRDDYLKVRSITVASTYIAVYPKVLKYWDT